MGQLEGRKDGIQKMTIREFSEKYQVPYHIVYEATYRVPSRPTMRKDREYPENQLFAEVRSILSRRIEKSRAVLAKQEKAMEMMRCYHP